MHEYMLLRDMQWSHEMVHIKTSKGHITTFKYTPLEVVSRHRDPRHQER